MALSQTITKRLMLARYLFNEAKSALRSNREVAIFASINLLQDAIEIFFLAAADQLRVDINRRTEFEQYIDKINDRLPESLPFRQRLFEINKVRVLSKHNGIPPNRTELTGYIEDARLFFEEACGKIFASSFWTISLIDLLPNYGARYFVEVAEKLFNEGKYYECLIECRKAIFYEIESAYTIELFDREEGLLHAAMCKAPEHTREKSFIEKFVKDPFDYIQLDHSRVDADLLKDGIEPAVFWNIWRLTPAVYQSQSPFREEPAPFMVKQDLTMFDEDALESSAAYVLEQTIDILLKRAKTRSLFLTMEADINYSSRPKNGKAFKVYAKADKKSVVVGEVPGTATWLTLKYRTPGLNGGTFWLISFMDGLENGVGPGVDVAFEGYADESDLDLGE